METALSLMVFASFALVAGAIYLWRKKGWGQQVMLMLILALVMVVNIAIWTLPDSEGAAPLDHLAERR